MFSTGLMSKVDNQKLTPNQSKTNRPPITSHLYSESQSQKKSPRFASKGLTTKKQLKRY